MKMTNKQMEIMRVVMAGNKDEEGTTVSWCDIQEIRDRITYKCSREAMICSIKFLERKGMLEIRPRAEIRDGRRKTIYVPTNLAFDMLAFKPVSMEELLSVSL